MKILHTVEFYDPSVGGAQEVVKQLSERLVERGHQVTVATTKLKNRKQKTINGVNIEEFDIAGNAVKGLKGEVERYKEFLVKSNFEVVMNYAAQEWTADVFFEVMDQVQGKKVFVPCGFSGLHEPRYSEYFRQMPMIMKMYDMNVFLSNTYRDIEFAKKNGIENFTVIPNGADERAFLGEDKMDIRKRLNIPESNLLILLVGSHTGKKGHYEAMEIFKKAAIPRSTLLIIGNPISKACTNNCKQQQIWFGLNPLNRMAGRQILVEDLTRAETIAAYKTADVFLFPSRIECSPLVLFEAMAAKLPFLTSKVGNAEEIIGWSHGGQLIPDDIYQSARILKSLVADKGKRQEMGKSGFKAWKQRFTWDKITSQYERLYTSL